MQVKKILLQVKLISLLSLSTLSLIQVSQPVAFQPAGPALKQAYTTKFGTFILNPTALGKYKATMQPLPLGDTITQDGTFERGIIMSYVILMAYGANLRDIKDVSQFFKLPLTETKGISATKYNLNDNIQAIFNFDATLDRLPIITQVNNHNPFAEQPIPGVRLFKATAINTYQYIVEQIGHAPKGNKNAIAALEAFESILWKLYDKQVYYITITPSAVSKVANYIPGVSKIMPKGIRGPGSWFKDDPDLKQILDEIRQLAEVAEYHSPALGARMKRAANSYQDWRKYTTGALAVGTGLTAAALHLASLDSSSSSDF